MTTQSISAGSASRSVAVATASPKRYHPALVALHWLIALLMLGAFLFANENEGERGQFEGTRGNFNPPALSQGNPPAQPFDLDASSQGGGVFSSIGIHMILGLTILILLVVRLIVRWTTKHPQWASTGSKLLDWVGGLTHFGLYLLTFGMVATGISLADQRGILAQTFGIGSTPAPGNFGRGGFSLGLLHGGIWTLLLLLIMLHIGAALYHQFVIKDNLLERMWFGKRE